MKIKKRIIVSDFLELLIVLAMVFLIITIYVPRAIWDEEDVFQRESRYRMKNVFKVESFYNLLTGSYTEDALWALSVVNAVRDSLTADTTFLGDQTIGIEPGSILVSIPRGYDVEYDTSFGFLKSRRDTVIDTTVTIVMYSEDISRNDTMFIRKKELPGMQSSENFVSLIEETPTERVELVNYYDSYMPDSSMFFCPLTRDIFEVSLQEDKTLRVASPIDYVYKEGRYFLFSFRAYNHGYIDDGTYSWD